MRRFVDDDGCVDAEFSMGAKENGSSISEEPLPFKVGYRRAI